MLCPVTISNLRMGISAVHLTALIQDQTAEGYFQIRARSNSYPRLPVHLVTLVAEVPSMTIDVASTPTSVKRAKIGEDEGR